MRIFQFFVTMWKGVVSMFITNTASANPEVAYAGIVQQRIEDRQKLLTAVSRVHAEAKRVSEERALTERDLERTKRELAAAVKLDKKQAGALLVQKRKQLEDRLAEIVPRDETMQAEVKRLLSDVDAFNRQIKALQDEARINVAKLRSARATKQVLDQIEGLSIRGDDQALEAIRSAVRDEMSGVEIRQTLRGKDIDFQLREVEEAAAGDASLLEFEQLRAELDRTEGTAEAAAPATGSGGKQI